VAKVREAIAEAMPDILAALVKRAKEGDPQAARLLLERAIPALKPIELPFPVPVSVPDTGGLVDRAEAILAATTRGDIAPGQAADLLAALGGIARLREIEDLEERIKALEETQE
jgi:hypothetical protein